MAFRKAMTAFNAEPWENEPEGNQWEQVLSYERSLKKADSLKRCKDLVSKLFPKRKRVCGWRPFHCLLKLMQLFLKMDLP